MGRIEFQEDNVLVGSEKAIISIRNYDYEPSFSPDVKSIIQCNLM
jgi:hypothetical protein